MELQEFDEVYKLMEAAFPDTETRTREGQQDLLAHPNYRIDVERDADGQMLGFLASWNWNCFDLWNISP